MERNVGMKWDERSGAERNRPESNRIEWGGIIQLPPNTKRITSLVQRSMSFEVSRSALYAIK